MTEKEKLETIRAEIFWRYDTLKLCNSSEAKYRREAYKELLDFINSLSEDVNEDLEEVAEEYAKENYPDEPSAGQFGTGDYTPRIDMSAERERAIDDFVAGANWQKKQPLTRNQILNVWTLGNEWKEITKDIFSTEHGTQLEYIKKHWKEGDYYKED